MKTLYLPAPKYISEKGDYKMIEVTKDEAQYIRENAKNARVTVVGKGKNKRQKRRFADESRETFRLLKAYHKKWGGLNG